MYFLKHLLLVNFIIGLNINSLAQEELMDITEYNTNIVLEMPYVTPNNFMGEKVYACEICLLQPEVVKALIEVNTYFNNKGYRIKIYDCYRTLDVQSKMWKLVPRATYVANPENGGSIHNRGAAVDLTLVKLDNSEVVMGTDFDFFDETSFLSHCR